MLVKLLVVLGLAASMTQCKTSKVKSPQKPNQTADADGQSFDMPKFLLTQNTGSKANLAVKEGSIKVDPFLIGDTNYVVVRFAPDSAEDAHYGAIKFCFDIDKPQKQCFPVIYSPLFMAEFTPPEAYNNKPVVGGMSVQVSACTAAKDEDSGCGAWSEEARFSFSTPNPVASDQKALLDQRAANLEQLNGFVKNKLEKPATAFKAAFEKKYEYPKTNNYLNASKEEQMLYTTAHNIVQAPWAMSAVFATSILESLADASEGENGAALALTQEQELGEKTDITNSLNCEAAGYIWVNEERACYQPKKDENTGPEITLRWTNNQTLTGQILIFGAVVGGGTWKAIDYVGEQRARQNTLIKLYEDGVTLNPTQSAQVRSGEIKPVFSDRTLQFVDSQGKAVDLGVELKTDRYKPTATFTAKRKNVIAGAAIGIAAIAGTILWIDGETSYGLTSPSTYQEHLKAFKGNLAENTKALAQLKNTQCEIEKQLFGTECI